MRKAIRPDLDKVHRLIASTKSRLEPVPYIQAAKPAKRELLNAIPYYLLAYGGNIKLLAVYVKQPVLKVILLGLAKALEGAARYYKIEVKELL